MAADNQRRHNVDCYLGKASVRGGLLNYLVNRTAVPASNWVSVVA